MKKGIYSLAGLLALVAMPGFATTLTFDLDSSAGGILGPGYGPFSGVSITSVTAWTTADVTTGAFTSSTANQYAGGLGVCSTGENCTSAPEHQTDNNGKFEFLLFKFNTAVNLSSVLLNNFGGTGTNDADLSYWTRTNSSALDLATLSVNTLTTTGGFSAEQHDLYGNAGGTATSVTCNPSLGATLCLSDGLSGNNTSYLLIGAYIGTADANKDYFKVDSLVVNTIGSAPEPSTFATFGLALAGLGFIMMQRRRRAASSN